MVGSRTKAVAGKSELVASWETPLKDQTTGLRGFRGLLKALKGAELSHMRRKTEDWPHEEK
jgi:hypothetical protein